MSRNNLIVHIDPAIASTNIGDLIISEAVYSQLFEMFQGERIISIGSREIGAWSKVLVDEADFVFFGGSNALSADPVFGYRQFAMGFMEWFRLRNIILMGVGWWQYQETLGLLSKSFYRKVLRNDLIHAVRDEYTLRKMRELGVKNVINTGCPTMWGLVDFESVVQDSVIVTLTDYNRNQERDKQILKNALMKFNKVHFWPQGKNDLQYIRLLGSGIDLQRISYIAPTLSSFDACLAEGATYIGTRLHAGIRALQLKCPAYIVPIDNRATELARTEAISLVSPQLEFIDSGADFKFNYKKRNEIDIFLSQFN